MLTSRAAHSGRPAQLFKVLAALALTTKVLNEANQIHSLFHGNPHNPMLFKHTMERLVAAEPLTFAQLTKKEKVA